MSQLQKLQVRNKMEVGENNLLPEYFLLLIAMLNAIISICFNNVLEAYYHRSNNCSGIRFYIFKFSIN